MSYKNRIKNFHKYKKNIDQNVLLVGCGRWGKVILKEIYTNFKNINKIYVLTKFSNNLRKFAKNNNIKKLIIIKNLKKVKKLNCKHAIIVKKNNFHFHFTKKLLLSNFNILVEKPFVGEVKQAKYLINLSKKNNLHLFISLPFLYGYYFHYIRDKLIKKQHVKALKFFWYDKPFEFRYNSIKQFDKKISFLEDVFYHIFSISNIFFGKGNFSFPEKEFNLGKRQLITGVYKKRKVIINCSRNMPKRKRILEICLSNNKKIIINFSKNVIVKVMGKKRLLASEKNSKTLKYQLFRFLNLNLYKDKSCPNDVRNLNHLFLSLNLLKKKLIKIKN